MLTQDTLNNHKLRFKNYFEKEKSCDKVVVTTIKLIQLKFLFLINLKL